ncbi:MAG: sigma-70 family RNA polymerase sigma factor [Armatimonadetes bacterium]|nr:sigma-70 family RNA polymerase sigma factor [Armatimonadota bacterium]
MEEDRGSEFEALLEPHLPRIYRLAYRMAGNHEDAEDLVQEAVLQAYRDYHQRDAAARFDRWLARIQVTTCLDFFRRRRRPVVSLDAPAAGTGSDWGDALPSAHGDPVLAAEQNDLRRAIQHALDALPTAYRVVVVLADMEGLAYDEIAAMLRVPVGTVRSRLHRGRELLRKRLAPVLREGRGNR